jgi:polysaccharide export outer membrane protein
MSIRIAMFISRVTLCTGLVVPLVWSQQATSPVQGPQTQAGANEDAPTQQLRPNYVLGPGDQIVIRAFEVDEISDKPFRIDSEGVVNLPILGNIHAAGLTVEQFEGVLTERLKSIVKNPQVTASVTQYRSEPIFVTGYFKTTGIIPLQGRRTLLDVLATVGGVQPNASRRIRVTRHLEMGPIPLPNAVVDPEKKVSTVEISIGSLRENLNPAEDIVLQPLDTISVDRAEMVYVSGEVNKVGGLELAERDSISVTQAIAMVGGLAKDAAPEKAQVLRQVFNSSRRAEISINLKKVLQGKESDFPLLPNDVLYVPRSGHSVAWGKVGLIAIPMATGLIYVLAQKL